MTAYIEAQFNLLAKSVDSKFKVSADYSDATAQIARMIDHGLIDGSHDALLHLLTSY